MNNFDRVPLITRLLRKKTKIQVEGLVYRWSSIFLLLTAVDNVNVFIFIKLYFLLEEL